MAYKLADNGTLGINENGKPDGNTANPKVININENGKPEGNKADPKVININENGKSEGNTANPKVISINPMSGADSLHKEFEGASSPGVLHSAMYGK